VRLNESHSGFEKAFHRVSEPFRRARINVPEMTSASQSASPERGRLRKNVRSHSAVPALLTQPSLPCMLSTLTCGSKEHELEQAFLERWRSMTFCMGSRGSPYGWRETPLLPLTPAPPHNARVRSLYAIGEADEHTEALFDR